MLHFMLFIFKNLLNEIVTPINIYILLVKMFSTSTILFPGCYKYGAI